MIEKIGADLEKIGIRTTLKSPTWTVMFESLYSTDPEEPEIRNALRLKRFRSELDAEQLAASMAMLAGDIARRRLIRGAFDWRLVKDEA